MSLLSSGLKLVRKASPLLKVAGKAVPGLGVALTAYDLYDMGKSALAGKGTSVSPNLKLGPANMSLPPLNLGGGGMGGGMGASAARTSMPMAATSAPVPAVAGHGRGRGAAPMPTNKADIDALIAQGLVIPFNHLGVKHYAPPGYVVVSRNGVTIGVRRDIAIRNHWFKPAHKPLVSVKNSQALKHAAKAVDQLKHAVKLANHIKGVHVGGPAHHHKSHGHKPGCGCFACKKK